MRVTALAVHPNPRRHTSREHTAALTDERGNFELKGLGDLEYLLQFRTPPDYAPVPEQRVRGGASRVNVALRAGLA